METWGYFLFSKNQVIIWTPERLNNAKEYNMLAALKWLKVQIIHVIPAIIYFFIAFSLINITIGLMLDLHHYPFYPYFKIIIGAIIVGKLLLIVDSFSFINLFPNKPMIWNILWRMLIYNSVAILFRTSDLFFRLLYNFHGFTDLIRQLELTFLKDTFWAVQMWVFMVFLGYIIFTEFSRVLGSHKMKEMIFG